MLVAFEVPVRLSSDEPSEASKSTLISIFKKVFKQIALLTCQDERMRLS